MQFSKKIGLSAAVAALVLGPLLGMATFFEARNILQDRIVHEQLELARNVMRQIDTTMYRAYIDVNVIANDELLEKALEFPGDKMKYDPAVDEIEERESLTGPWVGMIVFDTSGRIFWSSKSIHEKNDISAHPSSKLAFQHTLKGEQYYSDWLDSEYVGQPTVIFAAPVFSKSEQNRVVGVVVAYYKWSTISEILDHVSPSAKVHLLNSRNEVIAKRTTDHHQPERISLSENNHERTSLGEGAGYAIVNHSSHNEGPALVIDLKQTGLSKYLGNGWVLLIEEPIDIMFAPITKLARDTALIVLVLLLMLTVIYSYIGKRFVRPLTSLLQGVQAVARGNYTKKVEVLSKDEFGVLAENFNAMVEKLQTSTVSRDNLERIINTMTGSLMVLSPSGEIQMVNRATMQMLGYEEKEMIGKFMPSLIPDCRELITSHQLTELVRKGPITDVEKIYIGKKGNEIPVLFSASLMTDSAGEIEAVLCAAVDITDRKVAEEKIRESQSRFRQVFDSAKDVLFTLAPNTFFTSLNPAFEEVSGWPRDEWLHKAFTPLVHPDDLPKTMDIFQKVFKGESVRAFELRILKRSQEYLVAEFTVVPLYHEGNVAELLGVARDVTERKQMEAEHRRLSEAVRQAHEVVILTDQDLNIAYVNQAFTQLLGYAAEEVIGKSVSLFTVPENIPNINPLPTGKIVHDKGFFKGPVLRRAKDGTIIPVLITVSTVKDESGNITGYVGTMTDLTEIKRAENEIRKLNAELEEKVRERTRQLTEAQGELVRREKLAMLGQVAATVGNELRNPLGVMNNAVYFLNTVLSDADESVKEYLSIIRNEIVQADRVVSEMVDAAGIKLPHPEVIHVGSIIRQSLEQCAIPEQVKLALDMPEDISPVYVDSYQLQEVFRNLVTNALEAMPNGGKLEIRATENKGGQTVDVSITDTGVGITPENMIKLFQPLFTTKSRGIGLGLMVARNLTEANSGMISVRSEQGKGTTFTVTLPVALRNRSKPQSLGEGRAAIR